MAPYGGNPLACKVAIAALEEVVSEEELFLNARKLGEIFRYDAATRKF